MANSRWDWKKNDDPRSIIMDLIRADMEQGQRVLEFKLAQQCGLLPGGDVLPIEPCATCGQIPFLCVCPMWTVDETTPQDRELVAAKQRIVELERELAHIREQQRSSYIPTVPRGF